MFETDGWTLAQVTRRQEWAPGLFTFHLDQARTFRAGQFTKLGLLVDGEPVTRAYSIASAPGAPLEFYVVEVEGGALSPRLAALRPGDGVWVSPKVLGGFTTEKVHKGTDLWLIATGTGLAPYISMLRDGTVFAEHPRVVLVQGTRYPSQLGYDDELAAMEATGRLRYLRVVSREAGPGCLLGRITSVFDDGSLEAAAGVPLAADRSQVLICGNPDMITDLRARLAAREMLLHTPRRDGNVHIERYW